MGMCVLLGLIMLMVSGTLNLEESLSGFSDSTVWLVIAALLIAGAVIQTGFGNRLALWLMSLMGKSTKGIGYAICTSEFLLSSVIPSNTARGGGIHAPIVDSLIQSLNTDEAKTKLTGSYLTLVGSHANLIAASMFMTGMAANPLVSKAALDIFNIDFGWGTWILGSIVPGIISLLILPQVIYKLAPPSENFQDSARILASEKLRQKGSMSYSEKTMMFVLLIMLILWSTGSIHGLSTTLVAWLGVTILLITGTQSWDDVLGNKKAWDTLFWLGGLLTMADMLSKYGFIQWFVDISEGWVTGISALAIVLLLAIIYFYSMYMFSMLSGHIAAMVAPFFIVALAAGANPMITIAIFAYFSCLCGCTTNYSSGPVIIYYALGYSNTRQWFRAGFVISIVHIITWMVFGLLWWKILGWW